MKTYRWISILLLLALSVPVTGCSNDTPSSVNEDTPDNSSGQEITGETEDPLSVRDDLPADLDFSGRTYRILTSDTTFNAKMVIEEETGDTLNDAKFRRNSAVSDRFGITITEEFADWRDVRDNAKNLISAGDDAYELMSIVDRVALTYAAEDMLLPFDSYEYNDLTKPYWNRSINDGITIANQHVLAYSDFNITTYDFTHVLVYNKSMAEQLNLTSPYDLVDAGTWTLETYGQYLAQALKDLNGDGVYDGSDIYGFVSNSIHLAPTLWIAGEALTITKDENDLPVYTMQNDRMISLLDTANDLYWSKGYWYQDCENSAAGYAMFATENSLFVDANFGALFREEFRGMESDYGIIPYPKYDEAQTTYYARVEGGSPHVIPTTAGDPAFSSAILEALACESYNSVLPVYYEIALKTKLARDDQSVKILDMMMQNRIYDLGDTFFCEQIRDGFVANAFGAGRPVTASLIEKNAARVENAIKKIVEPLTD